MTACYMALVAALLNLINELFGRPKTEIGAGVEGGVDAGITAAPAVPSQLMVRRASAYFLWLVGFVALIALIGFVPAIPVFVFCYMRFGFGEGTVRSAGLAIATAFLCWLLFDQALAVPWPESLLGDALPMLRARSRLI